MPHSQESSDSIIDMREYFAAERTILAYVRTGLAMMGIGFVVARFSIMLRMLSVEGAQVDHAARTGHALWLGTALVLLGSVVTLLSAYQYNAQVRHLNGLHGHAVAASWLAMALLLGVFGIAMAIYLVQNA